MKTVAKVINSVVFCTIVASMGLVSCKKEELANTTGSESFKASGLSVNINPAKAFYCDPNNDGAGYPCGPKTNCDEPGNDCLGVAISQSPVSQSTIDDLDKAIGNGTVPKFFRDQIRVELLFPLLVNDPNLLNEIQNGVTTLSRVKLADKTKVLYTLHDASTGALRK